MHVPRLATDVGFVRFDLAGELVAEGTGMHRMTDSMVHKPSRFLGDSQVARNLATAHAVLAIGNQPSSEHPLVHAQRAILKDAAELDGKLLVATLTEPDFPPQLLGHAELHA